MMRVTMFLTTDTSASHTSEQEALTCCCSSASVQVAEQSAAAAAGTLAHIACLQALSAPRIKCLKSVHVGSQSST